MRKIIHFMRKNIYIKLISDIIYLFIFEYVANHIINKIPIARFRVWFYRHVLRIDISSNAYIHLGVNIYPELVKMHIGEYCIINNGVILDRRGGLYIGNNVNISREAAIYTAGHKIDSETFEYYAANVTIMDRVWLGTRAMVMPGVCIGEGAMVMPGAVVTKDVEAFDVVAGIPARVIGKRNQNINYTLAWRSYFL